MFVPPSPAFVCWSFNHPPPSVAVFGGGASKEVIKFDEFIREEPWSDSISALKSLEETA